ncbi:MAG: hypothetical protein LBD76_07350 [Prevotellaceae bacterium]|nr:hypothetical protein [Prevotellaceae bacterium]
MRSFNEKRRNFILTVWLLLSILPRLISAQEKHPFVIQGKIDFVSQNVWRGCYQAGVSQQPEAVVSFRNWQFSVWGTTDFRGEGKEIDLTVRYEWKNISVGLTDYRFGSVDAPYVSGHIPEANIEYCFPDLPLSLSFNTVIAGDDGCHSGYVEFLYTPEWHNWQFDFSAGVSPWKNTLLETDKFAVTKLSASIAKTVAKSDSFSVGIFTSIVYNPSKDNAFFIAGISVPF